MSIHSANRRFEFFLMQYGHNPQEPPDDRKSFNDMWRYPRRPMQVDPKDCKLIARVVHNLETGEIRIERPEEKPPSDVYPTKF